MFLTAKTPMSTPTTTTISLIPRGTHPSCRRDLEASMLRRYTLTDNLGFRPCGASPLRLLERKRQGRGVDAVPLAGRLRPVIENVAKVCAAARAAHFHAPHPVADIRLVAQSSLINRRPKTGPDGPRVVFGVGAGQLKSARHAPIDPGLLMVPVQAPKRRFGALLAGHVILLGGQLFAPLRLILLDGIHVSRALHSRGRRRQGAEYGDPLRAPRCSARRRVQRHHADAEDYAGDHQPFHPVSISRHRQHRRTGLRAPATPSWGHPQCFALPPEIAKRFRGLSLPRHLKDARN